MSNLHPLEVVARGSETQFQVCENLNYVIFSTLTHLARVPRYLGINKCPAIAGPEISRGGGGQSMFFSIFVCKINVVRLIRVFADKSLFIFWLFISSTL